MTARSAIPAYWVEASAGRRVPVVVSLQFFAPNGQECFPPAVLAAIDATVEITGRQGLTMAAVDDSPNSTMRALRSLERAMAIPDVIVLFRCQSVSCAEGLMEQLDAAYCLYLVRRSA